MKSPGVVLGGVLLVAAFTTAPAHGWQVSPEEHATHHPAAPAAKVEPASNAKLDELVAKMNAAQGQAKVDAPPPSRVPYTPVP
jgi:hypothetical protein